MSYSIKNNDVLCFTKSFKPIKIGTVSQTNITRCCNVNAEGVNEFNDKVLKIIQNDLKHQFDFKSGKPAEFEVIDNNKISGIVFHVIKWRGCRGYCIIQKSDVGTRFLFYLHDFIYHSAASFCTTSNIVISNKVETLVAYKEAYEKFLKETSKYIVIAKILENIPQVPIIGIDD